jgi:hypothetical protein
MPSLEKTLLVCQDNLLPARTSAFSCTKRAKTDYAGLKGDLSAGSFPSRPRIGNNTFVLHAGITLLDFIDGDRGVVASRKRERQTADNYFHLIASVAVEHHGVGELRAHSD